MTFSPIKLNQHLPLNYSGIWWIALSGGLDSCVLLHAICALNLPVKLRVLHINHQISPNANDWREHCVTFCTSLNIPFTTVSVSVKNSGRGIEDAAREARYAVFAEHIRAGDYLFTAHHADDQAETLLLRLMRGTGSRGLAAMAKERILGQGILYRPLLSFTRAELEHYAHDNNLSWVNDESNANDHYDRNFLRNQVTPLLRERWPQFAQKWQQTAELSATTETLLQELASMDFASADSRPALIGSSICLEYVKSLSTARRHNLIRYWLRTQSLSAPEQQHLLQFERQIIGGREDAETQVSWGNIALRVYRKRLYSLHLADLPSKPYGSFEFAQSLFLNAGFQLSFERCVVSDEPLLNADLPNLQVRFRQGGERCRPAGRAHSQTLKRLLQDYGVEPWVRESLPLVYSGDDLVAVANLWICEGFQAKTGYRLSYARKVN